MTPDEKTAAFNRARAAEMKRLSRIQADAVREIARQLQDAAREVTARLNALPAGANRSRLQALQLEIARNLEQLLGTTTAVGTLAVATAWTAGAQLIAAPLAAGGISIVPVINQRALLALQNGLTSFVGDASMKTINRINAEIAQVMIGTRPQHEAISNVERWLGSDRQRALTIVNDEIGRAYSASSQASLEEASERLPGIRKRWVKSGKRSPRPEHVATHGQLRLAKEPFIIGGRMRRDGTVSGDGPQLMYPRDPSAPLKHIINCGCLSIPVTDGSTWGAGTVSLDPFNAGRAPLVVVREGA